MSARTGVPRFDRCRSVAGEFLRRFGDARGRIGPPVAVDEMAAWIGFQVVHLFTVGDEFSGLVSVRQHLIGVNGNHHRHRRRFSVAHELAHILMKHPPESHCSSAEIALYNNEADRCGAELLVPASLLVPLLDSTRHIGILARIFDVSKEAMELRLREAGESKGTGRQDHLSARTEVAGAASAPD